MKKYNILNLYLFNHYFFISEKTLAFFVLSDIYVRISAEAFRLLCKTACWQEKNYITTGRLKNIMNDTACKNKHRYFPIFSDLPIAQSGVGRHKCAGCAYEKGFEDGKLRKESINMDLDNFPYSQAGEVRHRSPHAAYARGYLEGVRKSCEQPDKL